MSFKEWMQICGVVGALASFFWGVIVWRHAQKEKQASATVEAMKPFLQRQLELYAEAAGTAAKVATLADGPERQKIIQRFWELYWGELALVESKQVESAMVRFGRILKQDPSDRESLQLSSLHVANACRKSMAGPWNVQAWVNPNESTRPIKG